MLNKVLTFIREQDLVHPGDTLVCAVSGGTDSVALLFGLYLLRDTLGIRLEAAHFNHGLRGAESDGDEAFVRALCARYDIPVHVGSGSVQPGHKGLEAAARDARYAYFATLEGKIATAHTADDNAETILLHLVRGTGLKGLGGIAPRRGQIIRPMLTVTRQEAEAFLEEWNLPHREDSSNDTDAFLRNRLRRHVMPLLKQENPRLSENLSRMALRLRLDEDCLQASLADLPDVEMLKGMHPALRARHLEAFLKRSGVREPEDRHIALTEALLYSSRPSAQARLPGGVTVAREYDRLVLLRDGPPLEATVLPCPGEVRLPGLRVWCREAREIVNTPDTFTVRPVGQMTLRPRQAGDAIRLPGGTKSLKKCFIDRKIPAAERPRVPVLCDEAGILGVYSIGVSVDRAVREKPGFTVHFEKITE